MQVNQSAFQLQNFVKLQKCLTPLPDLLKMVYEKRQVQTTDEQNLPSLSALHLSTVCIGRIKTQKRRAILRT